MSAERQRCCGLMCPRVEKTVKPGVPLMLSLTFISPVIHERVPSLGLHHCEKSVKYLHSGSDQVMNHELSAHL